MFPGATAEVPANAVVTGGAGGLGRAFVEALAAERKCKIVSCDVQKGEPLPDTMPQRPVLKNKSTPVLPKPVLETHGHLWGAASPPRERIGGRGSWSIYEALRKCALDWADVDFIR